MPIVHTWLTRFWTQRFIDVMFSMGMLLEIAPDISEARQHWSKVLVFLDLITSDVLREQEINSFRPLVLKSFKSYDMRYKDIWF